MTASRNTSEQLRWTNTNLKARAADAVAAILAQHGEQILPGKTLWADTEPVPRARADVAVLGKPDTRRYASRKMTDWLGRC